MFAHPASEPLATIVADIAVPALLMYGLLSLDLPNPVVRPMPSAGGEVLAQISLSSCHWQSIEAIVAAPPDLVTYRLVRGPCAGLERHFHVQECDGQCRVRVDGHWVPGGVFGRSGRHKAIVQSTRTLLATAGVAAERLLRVGGPWSAMAERLLRAGGEQGVARRVRSGGTRSAPPGQEGAPVQLRQQLLRAVERQEQQEWQQAGHGRGTADWAELLAGSFGLDGVLRGTLGLAGALHDVGKIAVDARLFDRSGALSATGQLFLQQHPDLGAAMVRPLVADDGLILAIRHHHERWDGTGYPGGLRGEDIPLMARIIAVAEAVDAMQRPLIGRPPRSSLEVAALLDRHAGQQWDPEIARRMAHLLQE